jgi:hypothetical protein
MIPGSYIEQHSLMGKLLNKPMIAVIKDNTSGENIWYQVGSACNPAYITHNFTTEGQKGYEATISAVGKGVSLYTGAVKVHEDPFADNGYPVFFDVNPVDNTTLQSITNSFITGTRNITNIYTLVAASNTLKNIYISYRDSSGSSATGCLYGKDVSTFPKFITAVQSLLPAGRTLTLSGTNLLVVHPESNEHYLGIYMEDFEYLVDSDGSFLVDFDNSLLVTK